MFNSSITASWSVWRPMTMSQMAKLANRCDMPMLCYFLNLARAEADMRARELGGYPIDRSA